MLWKRLLGYSERNYEIFGRCSTLPLSQIQLAFTSTQGKLNVFRGKVSTGGTRGWRCYLVIYDYVLSQNVLMGL